MKTIVLNKLAWKINKTKMPRSEISHLFCRLNEDNKRGGRRESSKYVRWISSIKMKLNDLARVEGSRLSSYLAIKEENLHTEIKGIFGLKVPEVMMARTQKIPKMLQKIILGRNFTNYKFSSGQNKSIHYLFWHTVLFEIILKSAVNRGWKKSYNLPPRGF